jgi:hypothetical protein
MPAGVTIYSINDADHGMTRLGVTFSAAPEDHEGCLAFLDYDYYGQRQIEYVCTDIASHDEQLDEQQRAAREEQERIKREQQARDEAESLARRLRCDALLQSIKPGTKVDPALTGILRTFLPNLIRGLHYDAKAFFDALDLPPEDRWSEYGWKSKDHDAWGRMATRIEMAKPAELLQLLTAALLASTERNHIGHEWANGYELADQAHATVAGYYRLLDQTDWHPTEIDVEFRAIAERNTAEQDAEGAA